MREEIINQCRASVLPSYEHILAAKKRCYPASISISETCAEVPLQALLDPTAERLLETQTHVIKSHFGNGGINVTWFLKWDCDGSTGEQYKQKFVRENSSDGNIFFTSIVLLRLYFNIGNDRTLGWHNAKPTSTRLCRPLRLQFQKETVE